MEYKERSLKAGKDLYEIQNKPIESNLGIFK